MVAGAIRQPLTRAVSWHFARKEIEMSMMICNGIITEELCPFCDNPEPVTVRHGRNDNGSLVHDYDCDVCGGDMSIVGYPCPECAVGPANNGLQSDVCPRCHGSGDIGNHNYPGWNCPECNGTGKRS